MVAEEPQPQRTKLTQSDLDQFIGTSQYYRHWTGLLDYTDGVHYLAEQAGAYWLIDAIGSYQIPPRIRELPIQFWRLRVDEDRSALLEMGEDLPEPIVLRQEIPYTDFCLDEIVLYLSGGVLHLPSEY